MSAIDDLITQVQEPRLREQLKREWAEVQKTRKFGLVFDRHLPELVPIPQAPPRRGDLVARKGGPLTDLWRVRRVSAGMAHCVRPEGRPGAGDPWDWPAEELLVVRQFGEPIFPALVPVDQVQNGPDEAPWHCLIEADNYHALQLLEYLYAGTVDCIYIDPPYNTGARDWKYNNDYVDGNDPWRHSKWLSFMEKRLRLAKRLLNPETGVLVVTIDEHEMLFLGVLLREILPSFKHQIVTVVTNEKGVEQGTFARAEEYAIYCFPQGYRLPPHKDDLLSRNLEDGRLTSIAKPRWERLQRGGNNADPYSRPGLFYPIYIDPKARTISSVGNPLPVGEMPNESLLHPGVAWPIRRDSSYATWQVGPNRLRELISLGYVKLGSWDKKRQTWTILYLGKKARVQIESGVLRIVGRDTERNFVEIAFSEFQDRTQKTVWHRRLHDSGVYGSGFLKTILGSSAGFSFPKSIYVTQDAIASVVRHRRDALIVDFFAGSGTTLNALNLLNATDGGQRRCILVTNNEIAGDEAESLRSQGLQPGDDIWEQNGICRSVTWPRSKFTILGQRDDGTPLPGDYLTGKTVERERPRRVTQIGFVDPSALDRPARKKQLVALIDGLPQTLVTDPCPFIVSAEHSASVLFDPDAAEDWLAALDGQDQITDLYIVAPDKKRFDALKAEVQALLGPIRIVEEEKRPLAEGFPANLAYFKLEFLDQDRITLKRAFREILPLLWLMSGAIGPRPELPPKRDRAESEPAFLAPPVNAFAVLLDEGRLKSLLAALAGRSGLRCLFIVTDSEDAFKELAAEALDVLRPDSPDLETVQLYRDYLDNFLINRDRLGADEAGGAR